jgi:uncharacterized protein with GYD domain
MPTYMSQGRYSRDAMKGMLASPEDRTEAVSKLVQGVGGRLISYYVTFGEYDWMIIVEAPDEVAVSAAVIAAAAGGSVTDIKTTLIMSGSDAKRAFGKAQEVAKLYRVPGQSG